MSTPTIIDFVSDPQLLGLNISLAQETLLRAIYGLDMTEQQLECFRFCTGRETPALAGYQEITVLSGARGGKDSRIAAPIVAYEAVFGGHDRRVSKGERGVIPLVAQDARAARIAFQYIKEYFTKSPMLASMVEDVLANEITLKNGLSISCFPCTLRSLRGWSIPVGVLDELAFFRLEGQADSDVEIQASIRRGMISFPSTRLVKISTPYMKSGILYDDFQRAFGKDDPDLLVWRASSTLMNPSLRAERLDRERRLDPQRFAREYEAEFAEDISAFLPAAWVDKAIMMGCFELPPRPDRFLAAVDSSGGGDDAFTLAVVHLEVDQTQGDGFRVVQDVMRGWKKPRDGSQLNLEAVVAEIASILRSYNIATVYGDRYAAGWVRQRFESEGIRYDLPMFKPAKPSSKPGEFTDTQYLDRSSAYLEIEPLFATGRIALLDHPQMIRELKNLERRPRPGGKDQVDHPSGGHDDHANSLALAAALIAKQVARPFAMPVLPSGITTLGYPRPFGNDVPAAGNGRRRSWPVKS